VNNNNGLSRRIAVLIPEKRKKNEKNISAKQKKACQDTWVFEKNVDKAGEKNH